MAYVEVSRLDNLYNSGRKNMYNWENMYLVKYITLDVLIQNVYVHDDSTIMLTVALSLCFWFLNIVSNCSSWYDTEMFFFVFYINNWTVFLPFHIRNMFVTLVSGLFEITDYKISATLIMVRKHNMLIKQLWDYKCLMLGVSVSNTL